MVNVEPIIIDNYTFIAVSVKLPKTNLLAVMSDKGYIMCGALDVGLLNEKLGDRGIILWRAVGVERLNNFLKRR